MKFRNMAGFYLFDGEYVLLLYRVGFAGVADSFVAKYRRPLWKYAI